VNQGPQPGKTHPGWLQFGEERKWCKPGVVSARVVRATDGRLVYQMRVELGVLQMETTGRPDGQRPGGKPTYLDLLRAEAQRSEEPFVLSEQQCFEVDREFLQFYQRRICCLALREFDQAIADADHTLALMDFATAHSPDEQWSLSHEQYRVYVLFHRTQADALRQLHRAGPEAAIEAIDEGLGRVKRLFVRLEAEEEFERDDLVRQLVDMKESLRHEYQVGPTLAEQLAEAVAAEEYERAALLRDEIARRRRKARK